MRLQHILEATAVLKNYVPTIKDLDDEIELYTKLAKDAKGPMKGKYQLRVSTAKKKKATLAEGVDEFKAMIRKMSSGQLQQELERLMTMSGANKGEYAATVAQEVAMIKAELSNTPG